ASTTAQAAKHPISIIESGPAAGVLSSRNLAKHLRLTKAITFDMGGTTAKAGAIVSGKADLAYEFEAAGRTYHGRSIKGRSEERRVGKEWKRWRERVED